MGSLLPPPSSSNLNSGGVSKSGGEDWRRGLRLRVWKGVWLRVDFVGTIKVEEDNDKRAKFREKGEDFQV